MFRKIYTYIHYLLTAKHLRGHGVHSPFVYSFITEVLEETNQYYCFSKIENARNGLLNDNSEIQVTDFGTGSSRKRKIKNIAQLCLKSKKFSQLIFRIAAHYKPNNIIELGTSLGITTMYLASHNSKCNINTLEGCPQIAKVAQTLFNNHKLNNINITIGNIDNTLAQILEQTKELGLVFFDANHTEQATLNYYYQCANKVNSNTIFIFDDIYWSKGMTSAWNQILKENKHTVSIDLYSIGILFFNKELQKEHYKILF